MSKNTSLQVSARLIFYIFYVISERSTPAQGRGRGRSPLPASWSGVWICMQVAVGGVSPTVFANYLLIVCREHVHRLNPEPGSRLLFFFCWEGN